MTELKVCMEFMSDITKFYIFPWQNFGLCSGKIENASRTKYCNFFMVNICSVNGKILYFSGVKFLHFLKYNILNFSSTLFCPRIVLLFYPDGALFGPKKYKMWPNKVQHCYVSGEVLHVLEAKFVKVCNINK